MIVRDRGESERDSFGMGVAGALARIAMPLDGPACALVFRIGRPPAAGSICVRVVLCSFYSLSLSSVRPADRAGRDADSYLRRWSVSLAGRTNFRFSS